MASGNFSDQSIRSTSSSTPCTPKTPTPDAFSFLNSRPTKPDRAREDIILKQRKRRAEDVWDHFRKPQEDEDKRGKDGQSLMYCKICDGRWSTAITTNARGHLANKHHIYIGVAEPKGKKPRQLALDISFQNATQKLVERDSFELREKLRNAIDRDAFYEAQIQLITRRRMAFNCVEWAEYQALLMSINPEVESLLVESHSSIPIHIERSFRQHHGTVKGRLQTARSQIHYSIDLWKSPNRKSFLGICAQFVDNEYVLRKALLALPQCRFSHSGETMAAHILEAIKAYEVAEKTGYIVGDNASSNDTCVAAIARELIKLGIEFDGKKRRIRCCGHIINLSLEAFLFASTIEALEAAIDAAKEEADLTVVEVSGKSTAGARPQWTRTSLETLGYSESKDLAGMFEKELGTQANL